MNNSDTAPSSSFVHEENQPAVPSYDPRSARLTLMLVAAAILTSVLSGSMINVALPQIGRELIIDPARLGWLVTGFLLVFGISTPFYGRLADRFGTRRLFVYGLVIFAVGSLICALAPSYVVLLIGRLVQAAGSGAIPGLGVALISRAYPPAQRGQVMGLVSAAVGSGGAVGPTLGGLLAGAFGWQSLFVVPMLAGFLAPIAWRVLPRGSRLVKEPIDFLGGMLMALVVAGALLAATEASRTGSSTSIVVGSVVVAAVAAIGLVVRQRLAVAPFIPPELLRNRRYLALIMLSFVSMGFNLPVFVVVPLLLTDVNQLSALQIGLTLLPEALCYMLLGPVAGRVVDRRGPVLPIRGGLLVMGFALAAVAFFGVGSPAWVISILMALVSIGFAFVNSPLNTTISLLLPPERLSSGLSLNSMFFFLGGAFGTALVSAMLTIRASAERSFNRIYTGELAAFSDTFLVLLPLWVIAFALTRAVSGLQSASSARSGVHKPDQR